MEAKRKERKLEEGISKRLSKLVESGEASVFSVVPDSLLLDGKCAFRFVFNASSPKPGALTDILTCLEPLGFRDTSTSPLRLCGDDRKGKVIFRSELSGNFAARRNSFLNILFKSILNRCTSCGNLRKRRSHETTILSNHEETRETD